MYADVQLRVHTSPAPEQYEWQVVDEFGWITFRSPNRTEASWWIHIEGGLTDYTFTLKRVRVVKRDPLSPYAKAAMSLIVAKHGRDQKIACIKEVRAVYGLGLKDAKELVEDYLEEN